VLGETADDRQLLVLALIENLQREGLPPLDEGLAFAQLQADFELTQHEIAEHVGKSRGYVQNRIRLTTVPEDLQQLVAERPDTITHIYEIARVDDSEARREIVGAVRDDRISYAETKARVAALLAPPLSPASAQGENDLYKSSGDVSSVGAQSSGRSPSGHGGPASAASGGAANDLRKSFLPSRSSFLSPAEHAALAAVVRRLEAGEAIPEGDDLDLLVRLSVLVAALLPEEQ